MRKFQELIQKVNVNIRNLLALICIVGCFMERFILMFHEVPEKQIEIIMRGNDQMLAVVISAVIGYYFISNKLEADRQKHQQKKDTENPQS